MEKQLQVNTNKAPEQMRHCMACGKNLGPTARFCGSCGISVAASSKENRQVSPRARPQSVMIKPTNNSQPPWAKFSSTQNVQTTLTPAPTKTTTTTTTTNSKPSTSNQQKIESTNLNPTRTTKEPSTTASIPSTPQNPSPKKSTQRTTTYGVDSVVKQNRRFTVYQPQISSFAEPSSKPSAGPFTDITAKLQNIENQLNSLTDERILAGEGVQLNNSLLSLRPLFIPLRQKYPTESEPLVAQFARLSKEIPARVNKVYTKANAEKMSRFEQEQRNAKERQKASCSNCAQCGKSFVSSDSYVEAVGLAFHKECFVCAGCNRNLAQLPSCLNVGNKPYCDGKKQNKTKQDSSFDSILLFHHVFLRLIRIVVWILGCGKKAFVTFMLQNKQKSTLF
jgi:hypothetical protein